MSLLEKVFTGKLTDGTYVGKITGFKETSYQTDKGQQDAVVLTLQVATAEYDFVLFEKPFEWALKDLANTYFQGQQLSAGEILLALVDKPINFSLYTNEYAGRKFQRLSFNPNFTVEETQDEGTPDDLKFN